MCGNHWIVASNIKVHCNDIFRESVCIYDSMWHTSVSLSAKKQICSFVRPASGQFMFDLMNIQCQENMNDCGLFAIACATELVYGKDPCLCHFQPEVMRSHLIRCLESGFMECFPIKKIRRVGFGKRVKKVCRRRYFVIAGCQMTRTSLW